MATPTRSVLRRLVEDYDDQRTKATSKTFLRVATLRLTSARLLLSSSAVDSVYLAGYAAECSLKSLIVERTPRRKRAALLEEITRTALYHNIDRLRGMLEEKGMKIPRETAAALSVIARDWSTILRYIANHVPNHEAEAFLDEVDVVLSWAERSLS